jgi:hypothetical protein
MRAFLTSAATFFLACAASSAFAQTNPGDPTQRFQLSEGSVIQHFEDEGVLLRTDKSGRQIARVKLPKPRQLGESTRVVVSKSEEKVLAVYRGRTDTWPPKHKVLFLDARSLATVADLPLGDCQFMESARFADSQRLICYQSRNPAEKKQRKPTLAFVALDVNGASVLSWFELGGERRGRWFGPMFFGYDDDVIAIDVEPGRCVVQGVEPRPRPTGDTNYYESDASRVETVDFTERPASIIVLKRYKGPSNGEVWFVGPAPTDLPRRVASLKLWPRFAGVCGNRLQVVVRSSPWAF